MSEGDQTVAKPTAAHTVANFPEISPVADLTDINSVENQTTTSNYKFLAMKKLPLSVEQLLQRFSDIFAEPTGLPPVRAFDHEIPLQSDAVPPYSRPYRIPHRHRNEMEHQVQKLLSNRIIRESKCPYAAPAILVAKKDNSWRLCQDFRKLNAITIKNKFPIPVIEDLLDELHGAKYFTKLDLRFGYHQIRMSEKDIPKTAFITHFGHFEYLVMPFGLANAPSTFQALMNSILAPYLKVFVLVFLMISSFFSKSLEEHLEHLETVFSVLRKEQLFVKMSKCLFAVNQVEYLGHIISGDGVATDPTKVVAVSDWPTPANVTQLRGFLGLCGYYRRFVKDFCPIARPLHDALKKDNFHWTPLQDSAFKALKQALITAPVLALPDFSSPFVLETDASGTGLGAVLMQQGKAIAYYSSTLCPTNAAMSTYEKEALAIVEALKRWRHYLVGNKLVIRTDHQSLKFMTDQKLTTSIQHKLMLKLLEFDFKLEYKKGKENLVADALSRKNQLYALSSVTPKWIAEVEKSYEQDPKCKELLEKLLLSPNRTDQHDVLHNGLIRHKGRIYIGNDVQLKQKLLTALHSSALEVTRAERFLMRE